MDGEYVWATGRVLIQSEGKGRETMPDVVYTLWRRGTKAALRGTMTQPIYRHSHHVTA
jgi:hypothetical protein